MAGSWGFGVLAWREIRAGSLTEHSGGNVTQDPRKGKFSFGGQGMWLPEDGGWTAWLPLLVGGYWGLSVPLQLFSVNPTWNSLAQQQHTLEAHVLL